MKHTHFKTILREIRHSFGRFAAIIAIVALGTGFLVGILSSTPDMKHTVNQYYEAESMSDFNIKASMGLTKNDLKSVRNLPNVETVMPARVVDDKVVAASGEELVARIYGLPLSANDSDTSINRLTLVDGRMPEKRGECLLQKPVGNLSQLTTGDTLTLDYYDKEKYNCRRFTIVGIVESPYYFCNEKEPSVVGTGRVGAILYTGIQAFSMDIYTDFFVALKDSSSYDTFSKEYTQYIDRMNRQLERLANRRCEIRYNKLLADARKKIQKQKTTMEREWKKAQKELEAARKELSDGREDLNDGKQQLSNAKAELAQGQQQIDQTRRELQDSKRQLERIEKQVQKAKDAKNNGEELSPETEQLIQQYDNGIAQYNSGIRQLEQQQRQLDSSSREIESNEKQLKTAESKLDSGKKDYNSAVNKVNRKFSNAENKIKNAENKINEIEMPEWYLLDRSSNVSFARYKVDVQKVADIATVFPVFFFLVAALVSLTTMTRMVEEERTQIGTLKALGYSRRKIISKYMIYCGAATLIGCALGLAIGVHLLPTVIYEAYRTIYTLPDMIPQWHWSYIVTACALEAICTLGAAWFACRKSLKEKPALLMLPRAPKAGKRILLERIKPVWNRLSFTYKATARNIFRYKKHLFMTVIGIAGCTALMLTAFGLRDSMSNLAKTQFDDIFHYDMTVGLSEGKVGGKLSEFLKEKESLRVHQETMSTKSADGGEKISVVIQTPKDDDAFASMVSLYDRTAGNTLSFAEDSVLMSEKMAESMKLSPGKSFSVRDGDEQETRLTLTGITENYVGCYLYLGSQAYKEAFGTPEYNGFLVKSGISELKEQDAVSTALMDTDSVSSVSFTSQERESYETILSSVNFIILILIFCAGALAVVVLYNLTNININERTRELATLRVLGYYQGEVTRYVFREIALLTLMGTLAGLGLGVILHRYVILMTENTNMMLGREIAPLSFCLATLLTIVFSVIVDFLMTFKLKKIEMVESMKAVD